jgi:hypothetical protein
MYTALLRTVDRRRRATCRICHGSWAWMACPSTVSRLSPERPTSRASSPCDTSLLGHSSLAAAQAPLGRDQGFFWCPGTCMANFIQHEQYSSDDVGSFISMLAAKPRRNISISDRWARRADRTPVCWSSSKPVKVLACSQYQSVLAKTGRYTGSYVRQGHYTLGSDWSSYRVGLLPVHLEDIDTTR